MDKQLFNALCDVVIYHFCDVCRKAGNEDSKSAKLLVDSGLMSDTADASSAYDKYNELVTEYALDELPNGFLQRYDYWGAICITNIHGWNAPRSDGQGGRVFFAGDKSGLIMLFDNFESLEEYTAETVADLESHDVSNCF